MQATVRIDDSQWKRAAQELFKTSSRSAVDFTNGQALSVAISAVRLTDKADRVRLAFALGRERAPDRMVVSRRGGTKGQLVKRRGKYIIKKDSYAERIVAAAFQKTGKWIAKGNTMEQRARNFIASRSRSVGFIASGWLQSRRFLFMTVQEKPIGSVSFSGVRQYGVPKGSVRPATFSLTKEIVAEIENTALLFQHDRPPSKGGDPMPVAVNGLQEALNLQSFDMMAKLASRLRRDLKRYHFGA